MTSHGRRANERAGAGDDRKRLALLRDNQGRLASFPLDEAFPSIAKATQKLTGYRAVWLLTWDSDQYVLSEVWGVPGKEWRDGLPRHIGADRLEGLQSGSPARCVDLSTATGGDPIGRWVRRHGLEMGLAVPLSCLDRLVGVLVGWWPAGEEAGPGTDEVLVEVGQQLAWALDKQWLFHQLERAKREWETTFDAMNDAVWICDADQRVLRVNMAFRRAVDRANHEILGRRAFGLLRCGSEQLAFARGDEERLGRFRREIVDSRLGGLAEVVATATGAPSGERRVVYVGRDVTEAREKDARFQEAVRLAGLGQLAAAVAHEINNPLAYIGANLHQIEDQLPSRLPSGGDGEPEGEGELTPLVEECLEGVSRVQGVVHKLQVLAQDGGEEHLCLTLNEIVEFCLTLVWATLVPRATVVKDLGEVPAVAGDHRRLSLALANLLTHVAGCYDPAERTANRLHLGTAAANGELEVTLTAWCGDHPVSLAAESADREAGRAVVGLGWRYVRDIITELGGRLEMPGDSRDTNSIFLALPSENSLACEEPGPSSATTPPPTSRQTARILVIDDEAFVGRALRRVLGGRHDVTVAESGQQALDLINEQPDRFDVLLCDVMMPGMTGLELVRLLGQRYPELATRLVFLTGGAFGPGAEKELRQCANPVLRKPATPDEVEAAVAAVLEAHSFA